MGSRTTARCWGPGQGTGASTSWAAGRAVQYSTVHYSTVYILGGREGADNGVSSVYRLEGGAWLQQASMAVPRMDFACVEHQVIYLFIYLFVQNECPLRG